MQNRFAPSAAVHVGDITIADGFYKEPSEDDAPSDTYDFQVTDDDTIAWGGPLGDLSARGSTVLGTTLWNPDGADGTGFDIAVRLPSGDGKIVRCRSD